MPIEPYKPRHKSVQSDNGLLISITPQKNWFILPIFAIWLLIWSIFVIGIVAAMISSKPEPVSFIVPIVILAVLFAIAYPGTKLFLWNFFGVEEIRVTGQIISLRKRALKLGTWKEYSVEHVSSLRVAQNPAEYHFSPFMRTEQMLGFSGGWMAFDYGARTIRFAGSMDEAEAKSILKEITSIYPQYIPSEN
jgi:hypothetical protein